MNNLDEIIITCTDNGKSVVGYILDLKPKDYLEVSALCVWLVIVLLYILSQNL